MRCKNAHLIYLAYLLCSLGIVLHCYFVVNEIINGQLIQSVHYQHSESVRIPETILCVQSNDQLADPNHRMTVGYLNKLSEQIRFERLFERVEYLDEAHRWQEIDLKSIDKSVDKSTDKLLNKSNDANRSSTRHVQLKKFFFIGWKCLAVSVELDYRFDYYHQEAAVLRFFVDRQATRSQFQNVFHFFTKQPGKAEYGKIQHFRLGDLVAAQHVYAVSLQEYEVIHLDKFQFLRNPLSIWRTDLASDPTAYIEHLLGTFRNTLALTTKRLPLGDDQMDEEIDDELFVQFYRQTQASVEEQTLNFRRQFTLSYKSTFRAKPDLPYLQIIPVYFKTKLLVSNSQGIPALVLNLINIMATWLENFCFFDLHLYISRIQLFMPLYQLLLKLRKLFDRFRDDTCIVYDCGSGRYRICLIRRRRGFKFR